MPLPDALVMIERLSRTSTSRDLLRAATARQHRAVDRRFSPARIASEAGYREFLERSAAAVLPLERALAASGVRYLLSDWDARSRAGVLRRDLADFDIVPQPPPLPAYLPRGEAYRF